MKKLLLIGLAITATVRAQTPTPSPTPTPTPVPVYPVQLSWTPLSSSVGVTRYTIYWSTTPVVAATGKFAAPGSLNTAATAGTVNLSLAAGTYFFALTATSAAGEAPYSNIEWARVPLPSPTPGRTIDLRVNK